MHNIISTYKVCDYGLIDARWHDCVWSTLIKNVYFNTTNGFYLAIIIITEYLPEKHKNIFLVQITITILCRLYSTQNSIMIKSPTIYE